MPAISAMDKLERLLSDVGRSNGFKVERHDKGIYLTSRRGKFSVQLMRLILEIAENYGANTSVVGRIVVSKRHHYCHRRES